MKTTKNQREAWLKIYGESGEGLLVLDLDEAERQRDEALAQLAAERERTADYDEQRKILYRQAVDADKQRAAAEERAGKAENNIKSWLPSHQARIDENDALRAEAERLWKLLPHDGKWPEGPDKWRMPSDVESEACSKEEWATIVALHNLAGDLLPFATRAAALLAIPQAGAGQAEGEAAMKREALERAVSCLQRLWGSSCSDAYGITIKRFSRTSTGLNRLSTEAWRLECGGGIAGNSGDWWLVPLFLGHGRPIGPMRTVHDAVATIRAWRRFDDDALAKLDAKRKGKRR